MTQLGDAYGSEPMTKKNDGQIIFKVVLIILSVVFLGLAIWAFVGYLDQKNNVDSKINTAVAEAKKIQADTDEAKLLAYEKEPNREFIGPDDYGRVSFNYPKNWSLYIARDSKDGGSYEAYLSPVSIAPVSTSERYALRVVIKQTDYDGVVTGFSPLVKKGELKSSAVTIGDITGTRLDGKFTKDIVSGSQVIFKIRDKTLTVRTDDAAFLNDFNALISTIKFNQ